MLFWDVEKDLQDFNFFFVNSVEKVDDDDEEEYLGEVARG